jgi:hypothetical protein
LWAEQIAHGGRLRWLFTMPALDTVLSLDGGDPTTSSCHLWGIRIDTPALVVHASKDPVCEVLPRRKM